MINQQTNMINKTDMIKQMCFINMLLKSYSPSLRDRSPTLEFFLLRRAFQIPSFCWRPYTEKIYAPACKYKFSNFLSGQGKLPALLQFITGLECLPPLGLDPPLTITFSHASDTPQEHLRDIPYANTCANTLSIPVGLTEDNFRNVMNTAVFQIGCWFFNE